MYICGTCVPVSVSNCIYKDCIIETTDKGRQTMDLLRPRSEAGRKMLARVGTLYGSALPYYALVRTILETLLCTYLHYYALICTSVLHCSLLFTNLHSSALLFTTLHYCTLLQTAIHCYTLQCTVHCCGEQHCGPP